MVEKPSPPQEDFPVENFGRYEWCVLEDQDGKKLLLAKDVLERRVYHSSKISVTWENCELRKYLNGEFLRTFSSNEQDRIAKTKNRNEKNQWHSSSTLDGADTEDSVFLLSIEEVVNYFGNSGQLSKQSECGSIDDEYNDKRKAICQGGVGCSGMWWLRSPGKDGCYVAYVSSTGSICMTGVDVSSERAGVRPALWLNPE